jgi:hypothetical protein
MALAKVERFVRGPGRYKYTAIMCAKSSGGATQRVNFGHRDYQHYKDRVPAALGGGLWSHKDHRDPARRRSYRLRHAGIMNAAGEPAYRAKYSPAWFSYYYLW